MILDETNIKKDKLTNIIEYSNYFNDKTVLVTGGAGLIGKDLILQLCNLKIKKIVCIDLKEKPLEFTNIKIEYLKKDLNDLEVDFLNINEPHIIFHLAATFERTSETVEFWEENYINNVKASNHLGSLCKDLKNLERIIFTSSYLIYDSNIYSFNEPQNNPIIISENTQIYPRNICGASKLTHEIELNFLSHHSKKNLLA